MLIPVRSNRFKRDVRKMEKRGKDMKNLREVLSLLIHERPLPTGYRDHALRGDWAGFRDLHIEPEWLLLYRISEGNLHLARTGTHADLFRE